MKLVINENIICKKYIEGKKVSILAQEYGVSPRTIRRILKGNDIELDRVRANAKFSEKEEKQICKKYEEGDTAKVLGEKYGVNEQTISAILKRNSVNVTNRIITSKIELEILQKYREGITTGELSKEYGVSRKTILVYLNKNKIKIDKNRSKSNISKEDEINICKEYSDGLSCIKLGNKYNRNPSSIIRLLRRNNVKIRIRWA